MINKQTIGKLSLLAGRIDVQLMRASIAADGKNETKQLECLQLAETRCVELLTKIREQTAKLERN